MNKLNTIIMQIKKTFKARWIENLTRNWESIITRIREEFVSHDELSDMHTAFMDMFFSVARAAKIKPKALAKFMHKRDDNIDYAVALSDAINALIIKDSEPKPEKKTKEKSKPKAKSKAKNKA